MEPRDYNASDFIMPSTRDEIIDKFVDRLYHKLSQNGIDIELPDGDDPVEDIVCQSITNYINVLMNRIDKLERVTDCLPGVIE